MATAWAGETDYPPAKLHVGYAAPFGSDGAQVLRPDVETSGRVVGWKAICFCGWISDNLYPRSGFPSRDGMAPPRVEGFDDRTAAFAEWNEHFDRAVPELQVYELAMRLGALRDRFSDAVRDAQQAGAPRSSIASAVEIASGGRLAFFPKGRRSAQPQRSNPHPTAHRSPP
jgi:hypothetical protein